MTQMVHTRLVIPNRGMCFLTNDHHDANISAYAHNVSHKQPTKSFSLVVTLSKSLKLQLLVLPSSPIKHSSPKPDLPYSCPTPQCNRAQRSSKTSNHATTKRKSNPPQQRRLRLRRWLVRQHPITTSSCPTTQPSRAADRPSRRHRHPTRRKTTAPHLLVEPDLWPGTQEFKDSASSQSRTAIGRFRRIQHSKY
jgi:hypothetical protein